MKWWSWLHKADFIIIAGAILLVYSPALLTFFAQDDFTHLILAQVGSIKDLVGFFGPDKAGIYYRPISVQLITWVSRAIFGLRPIWFHALALSLHVGTALVVFKLLRRLIDKRWARLGSIIYAVHPVHFMSLYWWAEVSMVLTPLFSFLALYDWLSGKQKRFLIWLVLALLSNELAVAIIPIAWLLRRDWKRLIPAGLIALAIVGGRWWVQPPSLGTEYGMKFLPQVAGANLRWQAIRALGLPEGFGGQWQFWQTKLAVGFISVSGVMMLIGVIKSRFKLKWVGLAWWLAALLPVVFLEHHQSPIYQIIGLPGLILAISPWLKLSRWKYVGVTMFVAGAFWGVRAMEQYHWVTQRAREAKYYIEKLQAKQIKNGETVVFVNSQSESSTDAYLALGAGNGVKVFFGEETKVYFEDFGIPNLDPQAKTYYVVSDF